MHGRILTTAILAVSVSTGCFAVELPILDRPATVTEGARTQIYWSNNINPDCTPLGKVVVRIIKKPLNGNIEILDGEGYTSFKSDNQRFKCNEKPLPGKAIFYEPKPGFVGADQAELEYFLSNGVTRKLRMKITVKWVSACGSILLNNDLDADWRQYVRSSCNSGTIFP